MFYNSNAVDLIEVRMGEWNLAANVEPLKAFDYAVSAVLINPYYNNVTLTDNIALLVLASTVPLGQYPNIGTACLPKDDLTTSNIYCMVRLLSLKIALKCWKFEL